MAFKSRYARLRLKQFAYAISASSLLVWISYYALSIGDSCQGPEVQRQLCDVYARGLVAGKFCHELCVKKSILLSSCEPSLPNEQLVFPAGI